MILMSGQVENHRRYYLSLFALSDQDCHLFFFIKYSLLYSQITVFLFNYSELALISLKGICCFKNYQMYTSLEQCFLKLLLVYSVKI